HLAGDPVDSSDDRSRLLPDREPPAGVRRLLRDARCGSSAHRRRRRHGVDGHRPGERCPGSGAADATVAAMNVYRTEMTPLLFLEELPKTSTGKVQKFVLREKEWAGRDKRIH